METEIPNRRHRLFKNSLYGLFSWLFPIFPTIVVTPILVTNLGNEIYGVYALIIGLTSYFFTAGIGKATAKYVAEYRASGEIDKISDIVSSTLLLSISLGLFGTAAISVFARVIVTDVLLISPALRDNAVVALYLVCATVLFGTTGQIFQFVLQGLQRFDKFLLLTNLGSLLQSVGSVVAVLLGYGILAILLWTLIVTLAIGMMSYAMAAKLLPEFKFRLRVTKEAWRAVWRYASSIITYQVFGNLLFLFERGWIVRQFGAEFLTFYAVAMMLAMSIHLFTGSLVLALFPALNELLAERDKLVTLYQKSTKLILSLIVFAVITAVVSGRLFLGLWISPQFADASYWLLVIHVFTFALLAMNTIVWQVAESFKFAALNAIATLAWMSISIPLMIILSDGLNSIGVALARLAGVFVFIPLIYYVEKRFLGGIYWRFWASISGRMIVAGSLAFLAEWLIVSVFRETWITFFVGVLTGFAIYGSVLLLSGFFESDEKQLIKNFMVKFR